MSRREKLKELRRKVIETNKATQRLVFASDLSEEEMTDLISMYADWIVGESVAVGEIRKHNNKLYKVIQAHTTQADWEPQNVPALWLAYTPKETEEGTEIIPDFKQPTGAHDTYKKGDKVRFEGKVYESIIDNNAYSPSDYAQGWKLIEG